MSDKKKNITQPARHVPQHRKDPWADLAALPGDAGKKVAMVGLAGATLVAPAALAAPSALASTATAPSANAGSANVVLAQAGSPASPALQAQAASPQPPPPGGTLPGGARVVDPVNGHIFTADYAGALNFTPPDKTLSFFGFPVTIPGLTGSLPATAEVHVSGAHNYFPPGGGVTSLEPGTYHTANGTILIVDGPPAHPPAPAPPGSSGNGQSPGGGPQVPPNQPSGSSSQSPGGLTRSLAGQSQPPSDQTQQRSAQTQQPGDQTQQPKD